MKVIAGPSLWLLLTTLLLSNIHHVHCKRGRGNKDGGEGKRGKKGEIVRGLKPEYLKMRGVVNVAGYPCHPDVVDRVRTLLYSHWWKSTEPVFKQIAHHEIPHNLTIIYEDDQCIAWEEKYHKIAPLHYKLVPKYPVVNMNDLRAENKTLYGHLLLVAGKITKMMNLTDGYRIHVNTGPLAEQFIDWLHFDIFSDKRLGWPPGK